LTARQPGLGEPRFICSTCGKLGADVRPDFNWNKKCDGVSMK
jgi:hypothetical protein